MKIGLKTIVAFSVSALLAACGGGGGGGSSATTQPVANAVIEGAWVGTASNGNQLSLVVLEDGTTYNLFGFTSGGVFLVNGFDQGVLTVSGSNVSGTLQEYAFNGATATGTVRATATSGTTFSGTVSASNGASTFSLTPQSSTFFNYNAPASLSNVSGSWTGSLLNGTSATISIASNGAITGLNNGCSFTGTATPRPSGKNVFNVSLTFGASPCLLPNASANGIAVSYTLASGLKQLLVAVQDPTKAFGTAFFAQR